MTLLQPQGNVGCRRTGLEIVWEKTPMLPIVFFSIIMLVAALVFGAAMILLVKSFRRGNSLPAVVSPGVARKHLALIYLVRLPQILLAIVIGTLFSLMFLGFLLPLNPFHHQSALHEVFSVLMWIIVLLVVAAIAGKAIDRHRKSETRFLRGILRVDANSISTFALFFAALTAHDLYQLMPAWKPGPHMSLYMHFLNRDFLWIIVFFLGRSCIITILNRVLELDREPPPKNPEPPDSGPTIPFDPYILPSNRPLYPSGP